MKPLTLILLIAVALVSSAVALDGKLEQKSDAAQIQQLQQENAVLAGRLLGLQKMYQGCFDNLSADEAQLQLQRKAAK